MILQNVTGKTWPALVLSAGAVISVFSVTLVTIYGQTRILYTISRDGLIPGIFHRVSPRTRTPIANTLIVGAGVALVAGVVDSGTAPAGGVVDGGVAELGGCALIGAGSLGAGGVGTGAASGEAGDGVDGGAGVGASGAVDVTGLSSGTDCSTSR